MPFQTTLWTSVDNQKINQTQINLHIALKLMQMAKVV